MKWLFVTVEFPWPLNHGTWLRVYHLTRSLCELGQQVSVLSYEASGEGPERYRRNGITVLPGVAGKFLSKGNGRFRLSPYFFDRNLAEAIRQKAGEYDVVVLVRPMMLQYSPEAAQGGCVIADFVDNPILEERRGLCLAGHPRRWLNQVKFILREYIYERVFLKNIFCTVFVSPQDTEYFMKQHHRYCGRYIPNGVDIEYFTPSASGNCPEENFPTITFLGNLVHPPNEDAAFYLLQKIAPLVWKTLPETRFCILGSNPTKRLRELSGSRVKVTGEVDDIRPSLWNSTMALLPMQRGTGIKNKLLEAWAAGVPVVTTPLACQGVPAEDGENLLLGQTPAELAENAVRLIRDREMRRKLIVEGRKTVQDHLTWTMAAEKMIQLVKER